MTLKPKLSAAIRRGKSMTETTDIHCSSTAFEVLGGLWLKDTLIRIEHKLDIDGRKLDLLLKALPPDFSVEDAQLKAMTEQVEEAKQRLPKN